MNSLKRYLIEKENIICAHYLQIIHSVKIQAIMEDDYVRLCFLFFALKYCDFRVFHKTVKALG